jgi:hypothetical protein
MDFHWIRVHWFEVSALVLLGLNLWFVIKVLSVLWAVQDGLILRARIKLRPTAVAYPKAQPKYAE